MQQRDLFPQTPLLMVLYKQMSVIQTEYITLLRAVTDRFKGLDILVHNVGGSSAPGGGALALSDDDWQRAFATNLFAAVRLDRAFLPSMLEQASA